MQKNYFMKNVLAASMLLVGTSTMVSCQGLVDAIVGDAGQPAATTPTTTPTTPETKPEIKNVTLTTQGAQVNASSAAEVNTALAALAKDITENYSLYTSFIPRSVRKCRQNLAVSPELFNFASVTRIPSRALEKMPESEIA